MSGMRRPERHWRVIELNSFPAMFNQLPCFGVWRNSRRDSAERLPVWELSEAEEKLVLEFVRRKQAADLTYTVQFTDSLTTNWTDAVTAETITPIDDEFERVSVADHITTATATNRFRQ